MRHPDSPGPCGSTAGPTSEPLDPVATRSLDLDPGPVLCFARELGRLLGKHLARTGFPADEPAAPKAIPTRRRRRLDRR
jgi:hypothetical protein